MVFGVLNSQFAILDCPSRFWHKREVNFVLPVCVIMHKVVVEIWKDNYIFNGAGGCSENSLTAYHSQ